MIKFRIGKHRYHLDLAVFAENVVAPLVLSGLVAYCLVLVICGGA